MSVIWKYLDKKSAAMSAIKDFSNMKFIIEHTDDEIKYAYDKMTLSGSRISGMPKSHNSSSFEDRIVNGIEEIDILKERYRQAKEYMDWFSPAWEQLSKDEQYILREFYADEENSLSIEFAVDIVLSVLALTTRRTERLQNWRHFYTANAKIGKIVDAQPQNPCYNNIIEECEKQK